MNNELLTMNHEPQSPIHQFSNPLILSASSGNFVQSKMPALRSPQGEEGNDYAKQTQFSKSRNELKLIFNNEL